MDRVRGNTITVEGSGSTLELIHPASCQMFGRSLCHVVRSPPRVFGGLLAHWRLTYTRIKVSRLTDRPCIRPLSFYFIGTISDAPPDFASALVLEYPDRTISYVR